MFDLVSGCASAFFSLFFFLSRSLSCIDSSASVGVITTHGALMFGYRPGLNRCTVLRESGRSRVMRANTSFFFFPCDTRFFIPFCRSPDCNLCGLCIEQYTCPGGDRHHFLRIASTQQYDSVNENADRLSGGSQSSRGSADRPARAPPLPRPPPRSSSLQVDMRTDDTAIYADFGDFIGAAVPKVVRVKNPRPSRGTCASPPHPPPRRVASLPASSPAADSCSGGGSGNSGSLHGTPQATPPKPPPRRGASKPVAITIDGHASSCSSNSSCHSLHGVLPAQLQPPPRTLSSVSHASGSTAVNISITPGAFSPARCPKGHAMGITDFREGVYAFGIECDAASCKSTRIHFGALRYFCRDCYDEHPELGGFDYCISCVQPAMQMRTHPTPPASVIKALLQSLPPVVVCRIRRFTRGRAEVTLCVPPHNSTLPVGYQS